MKRLFVVLLACVSTSAFADSPALQKQLDETVRPFVGKYCVGCHSGAQPTAQFDLKSYTSVDQVKEDFPRWSLLADRLTAHEMPPKQMPQPSAEAAQKVIDWVHAVRGEEIKRLGGDPGTVLARRLSNAEYNYTIRDLTGQDMDLTRQFPVDPANTAGFDNSGESLTMSPALLNKYLQAARQVADHLVLKPDTLDFAPHLMAVESDHDKYAIQRIIAFYNAQPTDYAQYFEAAWRYRYRAQLGKPGASLASTATDSKVSAKYLPLVWSILHDKNAVGPVAKLQGMWNALPAPKASGANQLHSQTQQMRNFVSRIRAHTAMQFAAPKVTGLPGQSEPLHNWRLQQYAEGHRKSDVNALRADNQPEEAPPLIPKYPPLHEDASPRWAILSAHARFADPDLVYPAAQKAVYQKAFARLAFVFPDSFVVSERGRYWPDDSTDNGRLLSAGYHNTGGYYRDDTALMQLILDKKGQQQLNRLWDEFDYVADQTARTWTQYYFNQSGEVDGNINGTLSTESGSKRPVGHEVTDEAVILAMRDKYLARWALDKANNDPIAPKAFRWHFSAVNAVLRHVEKEHIAAEPIHLAALTRFAERAYRRPLAPAERVGLLAYYKKLRSENHLSHEAAVRDTIVSVLMSPDFLYRFDLSKSVASAPKAGLIKAALTKPFVSEALPDYSLASRLSYFLWSSMPDAELLRHAAAGDLHQPGILLAQARRMLKDPKVQGLATEFTGNWLVFRQFETNNSIDRMRFPTFDDDLREAMFQEPIHFMQDNIQQDGSVLDLLYGNYTFVNPPLARHYGMPVVAGDVKTWVRVDDAAKYGRGGILPMAVFMTQYSPGLRTSPVKRGNWVVQKVLGIKVPPPPPVVPELPSDESKTDLPIRAMLEEHHKNPFCAGCHQRFDSFGLVFEGYGPVGNARTKDLAGRPVDASATFPGGVDAVGVPGLQTYIREHRQDKYVENLCRKLLSYALNRSLQLSDESLVDKMKAGLTADGYRFRALVEAIVVSPQFLNKRAAESAEIKHAELQPANIEQIKAYIRKGN
jgi:Protein of unknown function (DUF1592)/Protein of unknown function (DUF1588)/Protein of unknown function (DUF1587)/Protein of unknown function (DUF1585)/Protein of unknown function (DUF1595)